MSAIAANTEEPRLNPHLVSTFSTDVLGMTNLIVLLLLCRVFFGLQQIKDQLYSLVSPTIFVGVLAYMVSGVFAELFSMTTLTILQCFIADEEMFAPEDRYAQNDLKTWIDKNGSKGPEANKEPRRNQNVEVVPASMTTVASAPIAAQTGTKR